MKRNDRWISINLCEGRGESEHNVKGGYRITWVKSMSGKAREKHKVLYGIM